MSKALPDLLLGRSVLLKNGHTGNISKVFDLADGLDEFSFHWIVEITLNLKKRECHFDPKIGVSLTGKRLLPASMIGRLVFVI